MVGSRVVYLAGPDVGAEKASELALAHPCDQHFQVYRRGIELGWIGVRTERQQDPIAGENWVAGEPVVLRQALGEALQQAEPMLERSYALIESVLDGESVVQSLNDLGRFEQIDEGFNFVGGFTDESDFQGIEQLEFEALENGEIVTDNIWMKASWLSFEDDDASLRFRFSYGREGLEDVASNFKKEGLTAALAESVFPESSLITQNASLIQTIRDVAQVDKPAFVERIVYFNAPNGGALFHHDVERGHDGVVYAQLVGSTAWLALSKTRLVDALMELLQREQLEGLLSAYFEPQQLSLILQQRQNRPYWSDCLNDRDDEVVEILLNHIPEFFSYLVEKGVAYILNPGDVILLPQATLEDCCWHTVFCLDDFPGEALSFAIRETPTL